ncbi:very-long-chain (3R)-3-hydroxyacyl-CoA dehydratase-like [Acanthaster planci]|uniref:Very-long-chain (3R)-3-hydroxyacyl-CoA dehydratase n=1 Tax=Acanthaster planci TaxID=133434 RepID=A0A8B7ZNN8_ACAPL|nr:very-long-chain (3R)-3-hydroxyacyl-CoA dehydratase-like [Acanthaster planci]
MSGEGILHPIVYWAQTDKNVSLRVEVRDVTSHSIDVTEESLQFEALGVGAGGLHTYRFSLDFYAPVNEKDSTYRISDRHVEINLVKAEANDPWPRVTHKKLKPAWLRLDFDKWLADDSDDEDDQQSQALDEQRETLKRIERDIMEAQEKAYADLKRVYLFIYNLIQFLGYSYTTVLLFVWFIVYGKSEMFAAFEKFFYPLGMCQLLALLEIVHPLTGLVKTGVVAPVIQVLGRDLLLFMVIMPNEDIHGEPIVCYLFMIWSAIEVVRYPFYICATLNYESEVISWLRYTMWIPLYPLGLMSEAIVTYIAIPYFRDTGMFSLVLPNSVNMAFSFDYYLYVHLGLIATGGPFMLSHMWKQRQKRFGSLKKKIKSQ